MLSVIPVTWLMYLCIYHGSWCANAYLLYYCARISCQISVFQLTAQRPLCHLQKPVTGFCFITLHKVSLSLPLWASHGSRFWQVFVTAVSPKTSFADLQEMLQPCISVFSYFKSALVFYSESNVLTKAVWRGFFSLKQFVFTLSYDERLLAMFV